MTLARGACPDVALFIPTLHGGGAERVLLNLAQYLRDRSCGVDLVAAGAVGPLLEAVPAGVRVVDLGSSHVLGSLPSLVRYLRRCRPRAMLSALDHANLVAIWAGMLTKARTKVFVSVHVAQGAAPRAAWRGRDRWVRRLAGVSYSRAEAVVAVSKGVADDLVHGVGVPSGKVRVIHNPVVLPAVVEASALDPGHPWLVRGGPPVILGAGRLTAQKDFATLITAFANVRTVRPSRLLILGEGEERAKLEGLIRALSIEQEVSLYGFTTNPYAFMSRAGVFVLSSAWEGFGIVLVEAMACGTPVVSTDCVAGPAEILENGKYGRLVPVGDGQALADAILAALDNPTAPEVLRARAADFSLEKIGAEYLELLCPS